MCPDPSGLSRARISGLMPSPPASSFVTAASMYKEFHSVSGVA